MTRGAQDAPRPPAANRFRVGAIVAAAIAVAFVVWLIVKDDGDNEKSAPARPPAVAASVRQLGDAQGTVGHEVYWAGRRKGYTYELTLVGGNVFIRYLPGGVGVGDPRPNFLTVGTYPKRNALRSLKRLARRQGNRSEELDRGGLTVSSEARPQSVYFAYPGADVQVEVYDPSAGRARRLVVSGRVKPLG